MKRFSEGFDVFVSEQFSHLHLDFSSEAILVVLSSQSLDDFRVNVGYVTLLDDFLRKPLMVKGFFQRYPLGRVFNEEVSNEVFGVFTNCLPFLVFEVEISVLYVVEYFRIVLAREGRLTTEEHLQTDP